MLRERGRTSAGCSLKRAMAPEMLQSRDAGAWALVRYQHDGVTHGQLMGLGFTAEAVKHRLRNGRLFRIFPGVYAVGTPNVSRLGFLMAAVLACGDGAALSHHHAGE